jgi:hypothetical protein
MAYIRYYLSIRPDRLRKNMKHFNQDIRKDDLCSKQAYNRLKTYVDTMYSRSANNLIKGNIYICCHVIVTVHGFGLIIGLIGLLKLVTSSNYSTLDNSHTRILTTTLAKSSIFLLAVSSPVVVW